MKKLLLILLCLPFIGFTQDDCGKEPRYNGNKFGNYKITKNYKEFEKEIKKWEQCKKQSVSDFKKYFDENILEPIEGKWLLDFNGTTIGKYAIKKTVQSGNYDIYLTEKYSYLAGGSKWIGQVMGSFTSTGNSNYLLQNYIGKGSLSCTINDEGGGIFCNWGNRLYSYKKIYPTTNTKSKKRGSSSWEGNGSGIIISKSGHIITNNHVIDDKDDIEVEFILDDEVQKFNAEIVQVDKTNDLAIIKIVDINFDGVANLPYNFKTRSSDVGTKVYAYGYPMALSIMGKEIKVTDGIISSKTGYDGNITTYQISAPIQGGNSGGPLFDDKGNFIGINSSGINKKLADNVGYSIKTSYVLNLIDILPKSIDLPSNKKLANLPLTEQIKEISKYVVLVKVK